MKKASVNRITEANGQNATVLDQDNFRVVIEDLGGVIPELSSVLGKARLNAHWLPWFRDSKNYLAGNFPCAPNFGSENTVDGIYMPAHGWTAALNWKLKSTGVDEESGGAWSCSIIKNPEKAIPVSFIKMDLVLPGHPVHYSSLKIQNSGENDIPVCAGYHNTLGSPFLQAGCIISGSAEAWATPPEGGEIDSTSRLVPGVSFTNPETAPLKTGGKTDIFFDMCPKVYFNQKCSHICLLVNYLPV